MMEPTTIPEDLKCPITHDIMEYPVTTKTCGHTFDAPAIYNWVFFKAKDECPCCRTPILIPNETVYFTANDAIKRRVDALLTAYPQLKQKKETDAAATAPKAEVKKSGFRARIFS